GRRRGEARRQMGRNALRLCGTKTGYASEHRRIDAVVPQASGILQVPPLRRVCGGPEDEHRQDSEIEAARDGEGGLSLKPCLAGQLTPQRLEPSPERIAEKNDLLLAAFEFAIKSRPPLDEGTVPINDLRDPQCGPVILHRN